jgi:hypothetical protein
MSGRKIAAGDRHFFLEDEKGPILSFDVVDYVKDLYPTSKTYTYNQQTSTTIKDLILKARKDLLKKNMPTQTAMFVVENRETKECLYVGYSTQIMRYLHFKAYRFDEMNYADTMHLITNSSNPSLLLPATDALRNQLKPKYNREEHKYAIDKTDETIYLTKDDQTAIMWILNNPQAKRQAFLDKFDLRVFRVLHKRLDLPGESYSRLAYKVRSLFELTPKKK